MSIVKAGMFAGDFKQPCGILLVKLAAEGLTGDLTDRNVLAPVSRLGLSRFRPPLCYLVA